MVLVVCRRLNRGERLTSRFSFSFDPSIRKMFDPTIRKNPSCWEWGRYGAKYSFKFSMFFCKGFSHGLWQGYIDNCREKVTPTSLVFQDNNLFTSFVKFLIHNMRIYRIFRELFDIGFWHYSQVNTVYRCLFAPFPRRRIFTVKRSMHLHVFFPGKGCWRNIDLTFHWP